jgi:thiamine-phosphate diphosphorylase / hydroxyethylthiazole kinase
VKRQQTPARSISTIQLAQPVITHFPQFISIAAASKAICDKYKVPIIINDRVDVALAIGATGVHLGQTDMDVTTARGLVPPDFIIGVSCNTVEEIRAAMRDNADYVGMGSVWTTTTKQLTKPVIGVRNVGVLLEALDGTEIKAVAIGSSSHFFL